MSEMNARDDDQPVGVPPLTRGWRMQMAMDWANHSREHMALVLGVNPTTISRWLHDQGKRQPRRPDMEIFARECRVPLEWLAPEGDPSIRQPTLAYPSLRVASSTDNPRKPRLPGQIPFLTAVRDEQLP